MKAEENKRGTPIVHRVTTFGDEMNGVIKHV